MKEQTLRTRGLAVVMAAVLVLLSGVTGMLVLAADTVDVKIANIPRDSDRQKDNGSWGHPELELMNGWTVHAETYFTVKILNDYDTGDAVYCIEPASSLHTGDELQQQEAAESFFKNLPFNGTLNGGWQRRLIGAILHYGYQGTCDLTGWVTQNESGRKDLANYWATQLLIWETIVGERDPNFDRLDVPSGKVSVDGFVMDGNPIRDDIFAQMAVLEAKVKSVLLAPSFVVQDDRKQQTYTLDYDAATKTYQTTLTDTNNVISNWNFAADGVTASVSGNKLTLTAAQPLNGNVTLYASRKIDSASMVVWGDGSYNKNGTGKQDLVAYGSTVSETVPAYAQLKTGEIAYGTLKLTKVDKDYPENKLTGGEFTVYDSDGKTVGTMEETETGVYELRVPVGTYTVKETKTPAGFLPDSNSYPAEVTKADETVEIYNDAESRAFINERSTTKSTSSSTQSTTKSTSSSTQSTTKSTSSSTQSTTKPTSSSTSSSTSSTSSTSSSTSATSTTTTTARPSAVVPEPSTTTTTTTTTTSRTTTRPASQKAKPVNTGDEQKPLFWAAVAALTACLVVVIVLLRRSNDEQL